MNRGRVFPWSVRRVIEPRLVLSLLLVVGLAACTSSAVSRPVDIVDNQAGGEQCSNEPQICLPDVDLVEEAALRKLALANEWHNDKKYDSAFEAYEAVLAENASPLTDAYALFGLVSMRLDRNSESYGRETALMTMHVLEQRAEEALNGDAADVARLLLFSARTMIAADIDKDNVAAENRRLREENAQHEEALKRLREVTLGR